MKYAETAAHISTCGLYRYYLKRVWDPTQPRCLWVMLNPSTADAAEDDPTIRRVVGFSARWGFGAADVVNLFALRATDPDVMYKHPEPVGPHNDHWIRDRLADCGRVICAWGAVVGPVAEKRARVVRLMIEVAGRSPMHLGLTKGGQPKHPLYIAGATEPVAFGQPAAGGV